MNKKGLSTVVATILILSIVVVSVAILSRIIVPFVKENLDRSSECFGYEEAFVFDEDSVFNCYESGKIIVSVSSKRVEEKEPPLGFNLVFIKEGSSNAVKVVPGSLPNELKNFQDNSNIAKIPSQSETLSYEYTVSDASNYFKAEIYTILKNGRVCEKRNDYINLIPCSSRRQS